MNTLIVALGTSGNNDSKRKLLFTSVLEKGVFTLKKEVAFP
jgi:hypothetical protein